MTFLKGYTINKNRLVDTGIDELGRAVALIKQTLDSKVLTTAESQGNLRVITDYAHSWVMMHKFNFSHYQSFAVKYSHATSLPY